MPKQKNKGPILERVMLPSQVPDWVKFLSSELLKFMFQRSDKDYPNTFAPDLVALNNHLCELPVKELTKLRDYMTVCPRRFDTVANTFNELLTLNSLLQYDTYAQSVARKLYSWAESSPVDHKTLLMYFVGYVIFIFDGLLLPGDNPAEPLRTDTAKYLLDTYHIVKMLDQEMNNGESPFIAGSHFNADLLVFMMSNLPLEVRVRFKKTLGVPLSDEDVRDVHKHHCRTSPINFLQEVVSIKEQVIFPFGGWNVSNKLIFPCTKKGAPIDYAALKLHLQKMMDKENGPFSGVKVTKTTTLPTRLTGIRSLQTYSVGRQRWQFTDPREVELLNQYFSRQG